MTVETARAEKRPFTGDHARSYDKKAEQFGWVDPDILFGLAFRHIVPGQTVLDIGIGTGLGSILFHRAGLRVFGLDNSPEMLALCREKAFVEELWEHDVTRTPYPLADGSVDNAVSTGLLHVFEDLSGVFGEIGRILKPGGVFVFAVPRSDSDAPDTLNMPGMSGYPGATLFLHSRDTIACLAQESGFELLQALEYSSSAIRLCKLNFLACLIRRR